MILYQAVGVFYMHLRFIYALSFKLRAFPLFLNS